MTSCDRMLKDDESEVLANDEVAANFYLIRLFLPQTAAVAMPGQFVMLEAGSGTVPLLRVPLSVCAADVNSGTIDVLYENMGPKTAILSGVKPGAILRCMGPVGNAFLMPTNLPVLVGGGIGVPPLLFFGNVLSEAGVKARLLVGARTETKLLPRALLDSASADHVVATDDGSAGHHGYVTELLQEMLEQDHQVTVYACGPHSMMAAVAMICRDHEVPCYVSLEEYMACGFGVCVGCVVPLSRIQTVPSTSPYHDYSRICVDGPVYDAREIDWDGGHTIGSHG